MIYKDIEQSSEAWYAVRAGRFTGTSVKNLFMSESTKGYQETIAEILAEAITGEVPESKDLSYIEPIARGKALEEYARKDFEDITDIEPVEVGFVLHHDEELSEWIGVSPDGVIFGFDEVTIRSGLEIKCPGAKTHLLYLTEGVLPKEYFYQVHAAMYVTSADSWFFMSYHPNLKPFILEVKRDEVMIAKIDEKVRTAIQRVKELKAIYENYDYE